MPLPSIFNDCPDWKKRNYAVKKLGEFESESNVEILIDILRDRRPAKLWRRFLGEPYFQPGFVRRNAWRALKVQSITPEVWSEILSIGLSDPYYEVRVEIYLCLRIHLTQKELHLCNESVALIKENLKKETNFEIVIAILDIAHLLLDVDDVLIYMERFIRHRHWRVRSALLKILCELLSDSKIEIEKARAMAEKVNMLSEYFNPIFPLEERRNILEKLFAEQQA